MDAAVLIRQARTSAGLSLRDLAAAAATSHSAIAAYEQGRVDPTTDTVERVVTAAGYAIDVALAPRCRGTAELPKGDELVAVLDLAGEFPARHSRRLAMPVFGR